MTWLYREPKKFTGGDLFLSSDKIKIDCVHNRTLIFPSMIPHSVNEISMSQDNQNKGHKEELIAFANGIRLNNWPIALWDMLQSSEISFKVEHLLAKKNS